MVPERQIQVMRRRAAGHRRPQPGAKRLDTEDRRGVGGQAAAGRIVATASNQPLPNGCLFRDRWELGYARCRETAKLFTSLKIEPERLRLSVLPAIAQENKGSLYSEADVAVRVYLGATLPAAVKSGMRWFQDARFRTGESITVAVSPFAPRKLRCFRGELVKKSVRSTGFSRNPQEFRLKAGLRATTSLFGNLSTSSERKATLIDSPPLARRSSAEGDLRRLALFGLLDLEQAGRLEVEHAGDDHRGEHLPLRCCRP